LLYPIPADRNLKLIEIADHWSREISPSRTKGELFDDLAMAWWRGEFQSRTELTRLNALRALFQTQRAELPFWVEGSEMPQTIWEHPDGSVDVLLLSPVPVPRADPEAWADEDCLSAYEAIARDWGHEAFSILEPVIAGIALLEMEFTRWTHTMGYNRPKFWATAPLVSLKPAAQAINPLPKNRPGKPDKFVKKYIDDVTASGGQPTKVGLEAAAKAAGLRGGRDQRRTEFDLQMGSKAPGPGRPAK
jgi:hypothetical protein